MNNIENIQEYIPTVYVNDSEPDLDETNLNKTEQAIKRVTDAANKAIDALKQLDREKLALSAISNVLSDATDKVPSLALANTMQLAINDLNSNLGDVIAQSTYKTSLRSPAKTHTLGIHDNGTAYLDNDKVITNADFARESADLNTAFNGIGAISMYNWSNTTLHTPHKEGITVYGNGFAIGFDIGNFKVQVAFSVGENRIFIRSLRDGGSFSTWVAK
ncbi:pyocin knob domain-containing protein [Enterocloster aldenensis]|uniref:pyocin knob domain-containing protein n=1 Tax=Enterocloster aldenensis TaxID=358742 RepID=UPI003517F84E